MAPVDTGGMIYLDDYLDPTTLELPELAPTLQIWPRHGSADDVYRALAGRNPRLAVYRRSDLPTRFHFDSTPRIAPVDALASEGSLVTTHELARTSRPPRGMHGYDPDLPSMRAIFLARGPSFRPGSVVPGFGNVHLYPLLAGLLGVEPAPSDGRLDSLPQLLVEAASAPSH